jgi:hypothetical protein
MPLPTPAIYLNFKDDIYWINGTYYPASSIVQIEPSSVYPVTIEADGLRIELVPHAPFPERMDARLYGPVITALTALVNSGKCLFFQDWLIDFITVDPVKGNEQPESLLSWVLNAGTPTTTWRYRSNFSRPYWNNPPSPPPLYAKQFTFNTGPTADGGVNTIASSVYPLNIDGTQLRIASFIDGATTYGAYNGTDYGDAPTGGTVGPVPPTFSNYYVSFLLASSLSIRHLGGFIAYYYEGPPEDIEAFSDPDFPLPGPEEIVRNRPLSVTMQKHLLRSPIPSYGPIRRSGPIPIGDQQRITDDDETRVTDDNEIRITE